MEDFDLENKDDYTYQLTILTPTFNRKKSLERVYESLKSQTSYDFQWIIIDDGSIDNTREYIESLNESNFLMEYHYKKNGGKHTAINYSHPFILGKYTCIVDSDD